MKQILLLVLISVLIVGCAEDPIKNEPPNSMIIYTYDQVHIADLTISDGNLELIVVQQHEEIESLRSAIDEIQDKETLPLMIERMNDDGDLILGEIRISPEDADYIYAVKEDLDNYGFVGEIIR